MPGNAQPEVRNEDVRMRGPEAFMARSYVHFKLAQAGCATPLTTEQPAFTIPMLDVRERTTAERDAATDAAP